MSMLKYTTGSLLAAVVFLSCSKSDPADVTGDPEVKFYTNNEAAGNAPQNSISYAAVNIPNTAGAGLVNLSTTLPSEIKFPVMSTRPVKQDVTIGAALDNSLVTKYNTTNNTNYQALPDGILNTGALTARILSGNTRSVDSIVIAVNPATLNNLTGGLYMAPIKLTTVSHPTEGAITSSNSAVTYIVLNVESRRIKYLAVAADALGTLITPRTSWAVTFNPAPTSMGGNGSVIDGSTTTYSRWSASPVQVDVNLQSSRNVTGIRLYTTNTAAQIPTQVEVSLSQDGITYDVIGSPLRANLTYASSYNYILFYKAISAKYVRLKLTYGTSTNTQNFRVTELDVYAN